MKRDKKRLLTLVLFLVVEVVGICAMVFPRICSTEEDVFRKMESEDGYAVPITIGDGSVVKIRLFRAVAPLLRESSGEIFALSQSGSRMKRSLYLKPVFMVTNVIDRNAKSIPNERRFFEYLQRMRW